MKKISIGKTRDLESVSVARYELIEDINQHRVDVDNVLTELGYLLINRGSDHDWTKIEFFDEFYNDVLERKSNPNFKDRDWFDIHTRFERHHINSNTVDDVNLFDIIEMFVDCIVTGKSRTGRVDTNFLVLPQSVINDAYWNTVKLLLDNIVVEDDNGD